jgi:hypothetical protein
MHHFFFIVSSLVIGATGSGYRSTSGPPGTDMAQERSDPTGRVSCLARHDIGLDLSNRVTGLESCPNTAQIGLG